MNYAEIKNVDVANGPGVRVSLFVSGCPHHCPGCFNPESWDFGYGRPFDQEAMDKILRLLMPNHIKGFSLLGGEPFAPENQKAVLDIVRRLKDEYPDKEIWCWTGYTWEELMRPGETPDKLELLQLIDILVDGRYLKDQHDSLLQFRGSRNQRILDVPRSLAAGRPVVWAKLHDQERDIPEMYLKDREAGEGAQAS